MGRIQRATKQANARRKHATTRQRQPHHGMWATWYDESCQRRQKEQERPRRCRRNLEGHELLQRHGIQVLRSVDEN